MKNFHSCMLLWKMIHLDKPGHLAARIVMEEYWKIRITETRLQFTLRSLKWKTSLIWNIRSETSVIAVNKSLKQWILDRRERTPDRTPD